MSRTPLLQNRCLAACLSVLPLFLVAADAAAQDFGCAQDYLERLGSNPLRAGRFTVCKDGPEKAGPFSFETTAEGPGAEDAAAGNRGGFLNPDVSLFTGQCADVYKAPTGPAGPDQVTISESPFPDFSVEGVCILSLDVDEVTGEEVINAFTYPAGTTTVSGEIDAGKLGCVVIFDNQPNLCGNGHIDGGETCDPPGSTPPGSNNVCRDDCTYCGDGIVNDGEECDGTPGCSPTCELDVACDLEVEKYCEIPAPPEAATCSDVKDVTELTMIWEGPDGVNVSTPSGDFTGLNNGDSISFATPDKDTVISVSGAVSGQSKFHVSCSDDEMNGAEDCGNAAGDGKSNDSGLLNLWAFDGMTGENGSFSCTPSVSDPTNECTIVASKDSSKKKKKSKKSKKSKKKASGSSSGDVDYTYVIRNVGSTDVYDITAIDDVLGELADSPIASLAPGDEVVLSESVSGLTESVTNTVFVSGATADGAVCEDQASATVTVVTPPGSCDDGKPIALEFEVSPAPCSDSTSTQDAFTCSGEPMGGSYTVVVEKGVVTPTSVAAGERVDVTQEGDKFDSNTTFEVIGANGTQTMNIHLSCSQPLVVGDRFGSLVLTKLTPKP